MKLVKYPNDILGVKCELVTEFTPEFHQILDDMHQIMVDNNGIGLAANQIGISKRFFVMKDMKGKLWDFINPKIVSTDGSFAINEGCLSAPGVNLIIPRFQYVTVEAQDRHGEPFKIGAQDIEAVCIQHEYDHLEGVFFLEKVSRQQRRAALRSMK